MIGIAFLPEQPSLATFQVNSFHVERQISRQTGFVEKQFLYGQIFLVRLAELRYELRHLISQPEFPFIVEFHDCQ